MEVDARYYGREQHGEASFHADDARRRVEWHGSESDHDVAATLDAIRTLVEAEV